MGYGIGFTELFQVTAVEILPGGSLLLEGRDTTPPASHQEKLQRLHFAVSRQVFVAGAAAGFDDEGFLVGPAVGGVENDGIDGQDSIEPVHDNDRSQHGKTPREYCQPQISY